MVPVPDTRLEDLANIVSLKSNSGNNGVCRYSWTRRWCFKGEGLGNKFLANIRETEAVAHVVRCFEDEEVVHVAGKVSPKEDIETINTELALADLET